MHSRWARFARGWFAAGFATFVAALSHTAAGGTPPGVFGALVSLLLSAMLCTLLTARELSWWRLTASVGLSQVLFHALFSGLGTPVPIARHDMAAMVLDAAPTHDHAGGMWLAHVAAGLVTIVVFRHAEQAFWGMADSARLLVARLVARVIPVSFLPPVRTAAAHREFVPRDLLRLFSPMRHRGPPLGLAA